MNTYTQETIKTKNGFKKVKNILTISMLSCMVLAVAYFVYWVLIKTDDGNLYSYTNALFSPIASLFFSHSSLENFDTYKSTSFILFGISVMFFVAHFIADKIETIALSAIRLFCESEIKAHEIKIKRQEERSCDYIKGYTICLSFNYETKNLCNSSKTRLDEILTNGVKKYLAKNNQNIKIFTSDMVVISSSDFENYDKTYESLIKYLSKSKKAVEEKVKFEITPTITIDAYTNNPEIMQIQKQHKEIKSLNLHNRACSSALFSKKYRHIQKSKYAGIPIGEYTILDKNSSNTYELNVVNKNLNLLLSQSA